MSEICSVPVMSEICSDFYCSYTTQIKNSLIFFCFALDKKRSLPHGDYDYDYQYHHHHHHYYYYYYYYYYPYYYYCY